MSLMNITSLETPSFILSNYLANFMFERPCIFDKQIKARTN